MVKMFIFWMCFKWHMEKENIKIIECYNLGDMWGGLYEKLSHFGKVSKT